MELQALLVLCGVGVAGLAMLLLMGLFSASGTSYEEAIAQQRRATTELLALAESKNKPKKKEKKAIKKLAKKEKNKENAAIMTGSELESEAPVESGVEDDTVPAVKGHVEFCPPIVVDIQKDTLPNVKVSEKLEEVIEKKENKSVKPVKGGKVVAKPAVLAESSKEEVTRERHNSGEAAKEQRKGKKVEKVEKKPPNDEVVELVREEVVPPLNVPQPSELTTDKLLKQAALAVAPAPALATAPAPIASTAPAASPPGAKNKKKKPEANVLSLMAGDGGGVNVGELVRVVRDAALSRNEIQILTDALLNKHHDPLPEHSEWTEGPNDPIQKLKKQLADKEKALADEIEASQALHAKLKELRATLNAEKSRNTAAARGAEAAAAAARAELHTQQARIQRLLEDNHQLAQDKLHSEAALMQQLATLQAELNAHALEATRTGMEMASARDQAIIAQQHAADLGQQLQEANRACSELEQQLQCAVLAEQRAQQELRQVQERLLAMTELQNEVQRLASRAQAAESNADKLKEEFEQQKQQLSSEIASLREQLVKSETELAELKQMKVLPSQNGLPISNANDEVKAAELAKVESMVETLREELGAAQRDSRDQRDQVARLTHQLQQYQDKNNELRTKNWKVMEALQSAEKALQTRKATALPARDTLSEAIVKAQQAQYSEMVNVLRAACPSAAPSTDVGTEWVHTFADNLKKELEQMRAEKNISTQKIPKDNRIKDLISQNEQSQKLVEKYKRIISDTEGVLSRLQHDVSLEEQRWAQQLADKQRELDELRQRTVLQMQKKIDALQAELQQAKVSNYSHTFADSERSAEERLMAGLTDKHNLDVCNGPLQMGMEEK